MTKSDKIRRALSADPEAKAADIAAKVGASAALVHQVKAKLPKSQPRAILPLGNLTHVPKRPTHVSVAALVDGKRFLASAGSLEVARAVLEVLREVVA